MTIYIDTSALVAAFTREVRTVEVQLWLSSTDLEDILISDWVRTEFSSAISVKWRSKRIDDLTRADAMAGFTRLISSNIRVAPVTRRHFLNAAGYAEQATGGLRAGDALHIAICADHGASLCTLDRRMADAAWEIGLKTTLI